MTQPRYQGIAQALASKGRYGDTQLVHMNPIEVEMMERATPGGLTTNPETGQKEAFAFLVPMLGGMAGSAALGSTIGTTAATALGAGAAQFAATGDLESGLLTGITAGIGSGLMSGMSGGDFLGTTDMPTSMLSGTETVVSPGPAASVTGGMGPGGGGGDIAGQMATQSGASAAPATTPAPGRISPTSTGTAPSGGYNPGAGRLTDPTQGYMGYSAPSGPSSPGMDATSIYGPGAGAPSQLTGPNVNMGPGGRGGSYTPTGRAATIGQNPTGATTSPSNVREVRTGPFNEFTPYGESVDSLSEFGQNFGNIATSPGGASMLAVGAYGDYLQKQADDYEMPGLSDKDYSRPESFPENPRKWRSAGPDYRPGIDTEFRYFAEGGLAQAATGARKEMLERGGYAQTEDPTVSAAKAAIMGSHPNPQQAIQAFIEKHGEKAFAELRARILQAMAGAGGLTKGPGDGMDDAIPATIDGAEPAALSDGEFVIPADVVSGLGDGSTDAGASKLYNMIDKIRMDRTGSKNQPQPLDDSAAMPV